MEPVVVRSPMALACLCGSGCRGAVQSWLPQAQAVRKSWSREREKQPSCALDIFGPWN